MYGPGPEDRLRRGGGRGEAGHKTGKNVREIALEMSGMSQAEAAALIGATLSGEPPTAEDVGRILHPHGQTIRGTGVGGPAGG